MARLDMKHGFLRYITKNQLDRDQYDKEIKQKEPSRARPNSSNKTRREAQAIYTPPHSTRREATKTANLSSCEATDNTTHENEDVSANQQTPDHKMADILFEDTEGITHKFRVYNTDDPEEVSRKFCEKMGYSQKYVQPLANKIRDGCSQYFTFTDDS
ncbi:hypothetical protein EB796_009115 [Bugula neritina]|uniref:Uncharacterized protein n=1 Tax=Bugula neritina TaxID=10212 RepID=A0A7J7K3J0_BUGNE|nr:hypothetical protein EB796_009115 [Bugula neritina]